VLLVTAPGISQLEQGEWSSTWYWSLTQHSAQRLFSEQFGAEHTHVRLFGNVFAATAFIQGVAASELQTRRFDTLDPLYPVIVAVRAQKGFAS
jgi:hypothetical protein